MEYCLKPAVLEAAKAANVEHTANPKANTAANEIDSPTPVTPALRPKFKRPLKINIFDRLSSDQNLHGVVYDFTSTNRGEQFFMKFLMAHLALFHNVHNYCY